MSYSSFVRTVSRLAVLLIAGLGFASTAQAAPCAGITCLKPGDYRLFLVSGGLPRTYLVHVPASYTGNASVPLLLDLHGFTSYGADERKYSGQLQESDKRGFIAVWPDGVAISWNAYGCCAVDDALKIDDVAFLRSVIVAMKSRANIDADRVFVMGISNGGGMAQRMACEAADLVRAAASVSYPLNTTTCRPAKPIGVTELAATGDATIGYYGSSTPPLPDDTAGVPLGIMSAQASLLEWKRIDNCDDALTTAQISTDVSLQQYANCANGVKVGLVTVNGGKHVLYSHYVGLGYTGDYVSPIETAPYIWDNVFNM